MAQVSDLSTLEAILQDKQANPVEISFSLLRDITDNFSNENKIGEGGFGEVYKGMLGNGFVAVKKLRSEATPLDTRFHREVDCLSAAKHRNIVRLVGYCDHIVTHVDLEIEGRMIRAEVRERLFCLEYMSKGSLSPYCEPTATDESDTLPWHNCYEIIKGICGGLHHLHEERIIHLDLKPANILLDDDMVPKISDFGLSRLLGGDRTRTITVNHLGTLGYMAPEYIRSGDITFKADIFSLGVIIERMVVGRGTERSIENVAESWRRRTHGRTPWTEALYNQVKTCVELSQSCTVNEANNRPAIENIIRRLDHSTANNGGVNIPRQVEPPRTIILSARSLSIEWSQERQYWTWRPFQGSRYQECAELLIVYFLAISGEIQTEQLSPNTGYTVYLVYRLGSDSSGFRDGQKASIRLHGNRIMTTSTVSLDRGAPNARGGGWMELKLAEFRPNDAQLMNERSVIVDIRDEDTNYKKTGLIVEAMEFRPNTNG